MTQKEKAKNQHNEEFIFHPDSKEKILGYQIPRWNEVINLAKQLSYSMKEWNYISWDFALTDECWVIVEANASGGLNTVQMHGEGIREKLLNYIKNSSLITRNQIFNVVSTEMLLYRVRYLQK